MAKRNKSNKQSSGCVERQETFPAAPENTNKTHQTHKPTYDMKSFEYVYVSKNTV